MKIKNIYIILFFLPSFLLNCGYSKTEKDKYPALDVFPKLSNSKFNVDSLNYSIQLMKYDSKYYYAVCNDEQQRYFCVFDQHFKLVRKVENEFINFKVRENGDIYLYNDSNVYKYSIFWQDMKSLKILNGESIKDSIRKRMQKDSLNYVKETDSIKQKTIDSMKIKVIKKRINSKYLYSYILDYAKILLVYENEEYCVIDSDYYNFFLQKKQANLFVDKSMSETQSNIKIFDRAVLKNNSSGNHVAFTFYPSGYNYYQLKIKEHTAKFKIYNNDLDHSNLLQWKNPFNKKILIHNEYGGSTYIISLKNEK